MDSEPDTAPTISTAVAQNRRSNEAGPGNLQRGNSGSAAADCSTVFEYSGAIRRLDVFFGFEDTPAPK
jgi:hypothetical protein